MVRICCLFFEGYVDHLDLHGLTHAFPTRRSSDLLLGLAVFLWIFPNYRSAPLIGGMTLALMTMPVSVISGRNAIKAVPPSIRDGALAIGASPIQVVFHHVLPLALPRS